MAESELVTTWLIDDWLNWMSLVELTAQENTVCKVTPPNIDTNYSVAELTVKGNCSGENGGNCLIGSICDNLKTCSKYGIDIFLPDGGSCNVDVLREVNRLCLLCEVVSPALRLL